MTLILNQSLLILPHCSVAFPNIFTYCDVFHLNLLKFSMWLKYPTFLGESEPAGLFSDVGATGLDSSAGVTTTTGNKSLPLTGLWNPQMSPNSSF